MKEKERLQSILAQEAGDIVVRFREELMPDIRL